MKVSLQRDKPIAIYQNPGLLLRINSDQSLTQIEIHELETIKSWYVTVMVELLLAVLGIT